MKFSHVLMLAGAFALVACGDDSSFNYIPTSSANDIPASSSSVETPASSEAESQMDCSVKDGVKVFAPEGGESLKMGDTITVVYGSDVVGSGYRFVFKASEEDPGTDMLENSAGPTSPDGKTCYEQKVALTDDVAEPSDEAFIRVIPYEKTAKAANSGKFKVVAE